MNRGGVGRYIEDFRTEFLSQSDIKQASEDLHIMMTPDKDMNVRRNAAKALAVVFPHVHDKTQAWNDLIRFVQEDEDWGMAGNLCTFLQYLPDKKQAWKDLIQLLMQHKRTLRKMNGLIKNHIDFRRQIAEKLDVAFIYVPDKILACEDLHELSIDKDYISRLSAAKSFGIAYSYFHDKKQADHDLHQLTMDEVTDVRMYAADSLGVAFSSISDKMQSWDDIIRLIEIVGKVPNFT
jgi:hypothetical protein